MTENNKKAFKTVDMDQAHSYLPNYCQAEIFLRLVIVTELIAVVYSLASYTDKEGLFGHIGAISSFMQWVSVTSGWSLCFLSRYAFMGRVKDGTIVSIATVVFMTILVTLLNVQINKFLSLDPLDESLWLQCLRYSATSGILYGVALRYLYIQHESANILKSQVKARLEALQARIHPHFLFNSMNSIASLTHADPDLAEHSIENLSDLFRASLSAESSISLERELELTFGYIELEMLRLGDRMLVNWVIPDVPKHIEIPALTLQPLVENAIYHGIEPLIDGGQIDIHLQIKAKYVEITISNPVLKNQLSRTRKGNSMAIENIKERLHLSYSGRANMKHFEENDKFTVKLNLPIII